jgi:hypothetical protein
MFKLAQLAGEMWQYVCEKPISHNHRNRVLKSFTGQSRKVVKQFDSDPNWIA